MIAVLVETLMLPFESVDVVGIRTAIGVAEREAAWNGEGVMMMLLDPGSSKGAGVVVGTIPASGERKRVAVIETTPSSFFVNDGLATVVAASGGFIAVGGCSPPVGALDGEGLMTLLSAADAGEVVTTGSSPFTDSSAHGERKKTARVVFSTKDGNVAGGTFDVPPSAGVFLSVLSAGVSVEVGPSSNSVDVEVFVRYNAVSSADAASTAFSVGSQFQTPRSGKSPSTTPTVPLQLAPHASPPKLVKVQPLGSSIILTPVV